MSRGLGQRQRRILVALGDGEGLLPFEIRQRIGSSDRPNTRRAIRSLLRRGLAQQDEAGRLKLTWWGNIKLAFLSAPQKPDYEAQRRREHREFEKALAALRAEWQQERRLWFEEEERWERDRSSYERRSRPGQNQLRVIAVLIRYSPDPQRGLPKSAVGRIAGFAGDKRNTARAIRSLLERGTIQRSKDGERLRVPGALPPRSSSYFEFLSPWSFAPDLLEEPLDDEKAQAVLEGFGEFWEGVA